MTPMAVAGQEESAVANDARRPLLKDPGYASNWKRLSASFFFLGLLKYALAIVLCRRASCSFTQAELASFSRRTATFYMWVQERVLPPECTSLTPLSTIQLPGYHTQRRTGSGACGERCFESSQWLAYVRIENCK